MAVSYLTPRATQVVVEIDRVEGVDPPDQAIAHLRQVIERESGAAAGALIGYDDTLRGQGRMEGGGGNDRYSQQEISAIAAAARDRRSTASEPVLHIVLLDGSFAEEDSVLGLAINASTVVIFGDVVEGSGGLIAGAEPIWRSVLVHEVGHIWGLVELIERSSTSRHAPRNRPGHSPNDQSVMYWAIEDASLILDLGERPPDDFDADDRADLAAFRNR